MADQQESQIGETPEQITELTFDTWIGEQPEDISGLVTGHIGGLKSALDSERQARKDLEKQLKSVTDQLEAGSQAKEQLQTLSQQLADTERRATFTETAVSAGVAPDALRLAYLAAQDIGAFGDNGPDIEKLKATYPHLFTKPRAATTTAGAGTISKPVSPANEMDDLIRRKAGRL